MSVVATPAPTPILTRDEIRGFMRDYPGPVPNTGVTNILLDNVEFSDDDLDRSVRFTVSRYNALTPVSNIQSGDVPLYILLLGASAFLLRSEAMRQIRNQATVQDGDVTPIGIDDKHVLYMNAAKMFSDEFLEMAKAVKIQRNMESCYGGFGSGYRGTARNRTV